MTRLGAYALFRLRMWVLSRKDDPAIKQLTKAIPAKRRQHKRIYADIQRIRTALMGAQYESQAAARRQERENRRAQYRAQLFGGV